MITLRQVNIKNGPHHFFNDMTNIKNFDPNLLGIDQISFKGNDVPIYDIEYITMKSLHNENSFYLIFNNVEGYIECSSIKKSNEGKYLIFASTDKNKEVLENHTKLLDEIKD